MPTSFNLEFPLWRTESVDAQAITFKRASRPDKAAQKVCPPSAVLAADPTNQLVTAV
jgi:hypothetical protein